jgi:5-methylcytosine-specific restriction enzyme subunit McrC
MRRLSAFEHETVRIGGTTRMGAPSPLTQVDLDALARFNDRADRAYFDFGYRSVTFREMVGYVEVGDLAIEVLPKADRVADRSSARLPWRDALLAMLEVALGVRLVALSSASQSVARSSLFDLLAAAFVREVEQLVREGLARSYRTTEANGTTFRGRLLVAENLRANVARQDRVYVSFATFDRDIPVNQILGAALEVLDERPISGDLRARMDQVRYAFAELAAPKLHGDVFDRLSLGRSTVRYAPALGLARLILERKTPALQAGATHVFGVLFDMNLLWELYVAAMFRRACPPHLEVQTQRSALFWDAAPRHRATVRPDLVVRRRATGEVLMIGDTKWKTLGGKPPSDEHLKQMFVYNELFRSPQAVLIHPRCGPEDNMTGRYRAGGHGCSTASLGLFSEGKVSHKAMVEEIGGLLGRFAGAGVGEGWASLHS